VQIEHQLKVQGENFLKFRKAKRSRNMEVLNGFLASVGHFISFIYESLPSMKELIYEGVVAVEGGTILALPPVYYLWKYRRGFRQLLFPDHVAFLQHRIYEKMFGDRIMPVIHLDYAPSATCSRLLLGNPYLINRVFKVADRMSNGNGHFIRLLQQSEQNILFNAIQEWFSGICFSDAVDFNIGCPVREAKYVFGITHGRYGWSGVKKLRVVLILEDDLWKFLEDGFYTDV
jgi:hypothetical protein